MNNMISKMNSKNWIKDHKLEVKRNYLKKKKVLKNLKTQRKKLASKQKMVSKYMLMYKLSLEIMLKKLKTVKYKK